MRPILILTCCLLLFALPLAAQEAEGTPEASSESSVLLPVPAESEELQAAVARAERAAAEAERFMADAQRYAADASSFFNVFEAFGVVVLIATSVLGLLGFTRFFRERSELKEMRERFENDLAAARQRFDSEISTQKADLQALRDDVVGKADQQRAHAANAMIAMAMLPSGERQYKAQDLKGAAETYRRALSLDDGNPLIQYRIGYVYVHSDQFDPAEAHLKRALEIDPEYVLAMAALGYVYRRMGDTLGEGIERDQKYNLAENYLLEALKRSPKVVDDDGESWWGSLGGLYRRRGQVERAIYAYEQAGRVTPHSSYPFSNLALLYMAKHDREKMLTMYRRVERLARAEALAEIDNYWAYADIFTSRLALGKYDEAEEAFTSFLALIPPDSSYAREAVADTLTRLMSALGGAESNPQIPPYIARLREPITP